MFKLDQKKQLYITLTEPVVFLRTSDPSGRLQPDQGDSPTLVRGILTLNVAKPIVISSIEVELTGALAISHQEGIGPIDFTDKRKIYSSSVTVFRAEQVPRSGRASTGTSVGPGLPATNFTGDEHALTSLFRLPSLPRGRSERQCLAAVPLDPGPTPLYNVAHSPATVHSGLYVSEHDAQTPSELGQALGVNLEIQARDDSITASSHPHGAFLLPNPMIYSSTSDDSCDDTHNLVLTSSSLEDTTEVPLQGLPYGASSPDHPFRPHSSVDTYGTQPRIHGDSNDILDPPAGHSRFRLSLNSVLDAVKEITSRTPSRSTSVARSEERGRGRTRIRIVTEEQSRAEAGEEIASCENSGHLRPNPPYSSDHTEHREHHLHGLSRLFGLDRDHEKDKGGEPEPRDHGDCWREFQPGTYSYPVSFLLPANLPPTFSLPYGSLSYAIKGVAHRPGAFTSKLSCQVPLLVIASPAVGAGEGSSGGDPGPLIVQNQWRGKFAYSFGLGSRLFVLGAKRRLVAAASERVCTNTESLVEAGVDARTEEVYGTTTLDLTLLPIEKIKIWKMDVVVDQRIRYADERGRPVRDDDKMEVKLLQLLDTCTAEEMDSMGEEGHKHKEKHRLTRDPVPIPLLPTPISPHRSPLLRYLPPSIDPSALAGPGPYTLSTIIGLPGCNNSSNDDREALHFTMKQKSSDVKVEHSLRIVMRVELIGDEDSSDHAGGEKKRVDITIQTPIAILSCRCVPEHQTLPKYSQITEDDLQGCFACPCDTSIAGPTEQGGLQGVVVPSSTSSFENENGLVGQQRSDHEHLRTTPSETSRSSSTHTADMSSHTQHPPQHSQSYTVSVSHVRAHSQEFISRVPHTSRPPSPLARYERLVSGLESEAGEAPPSYESVTGP